MKLLISAPTGYNTRELLLPLKPVLDAEADVDEVLVVTPAADFRQELFPTFGANYRFIANPAGAAGHDRLLRETAPDVVVTPTFGLEPRDAALLAAARGADVPTCVFVASWDNVYKMERLLRQGYSGPLKGKERAYEIADRFAVWNRMNAEHLRRLLADLGEEREVRVVGAPRFDYFSHADRIPSREALFEYLGLDDPTAALIHGATTELYPFDYIIEALARARDKRQLARPVRLYASVHPGGDISRHRQYEQHGAVVKYSFGRRDRELAPGFSYLPSEEEIYLLVALFMHTDVLVNQSSTVAIESMCADTPVINVKYGRRFDWWRWHRSMVYRDFKQHYRDIIDGGGTTIVGNEWQLIAGLNDYLANPAHKQAERAATTRKMLTYADGNAAQRLLDFLKEMV